MRTKRRRSRGRSIWLLAGIVWLGVSGWIVSLDLFPPLKAVLPLLLALVLAWSADRQVRRQAPPVALARISAERHRRRARRTR